MVILRLQTDVSLHSKLHFIGGGATDTFEVPKHDCSPVEGLSVIL